MIVVLETEKTEIRDYIDVDSYIANNDLLGLLLDLDSTITKVGFDADYNLNEEGKKLQDIYDEIYYRNK